MKNFNKIYLFHISVAFLIIGLFLISFGQVNATLSFGNEYVYNTANTESNAVAGLKSDLFIVAYRDRVDTKGYARYGKVSGTTISYKNEVNFNAANTNDIKVARLSDSTFVIVYQDSGKSNYGTAIIGKVDLLRETLSFGNEFVFHSGTTSNLDVDRITDTKFVIVYKNSSLYGVAMIGDVSGTNITWGYPKTYAVTSSGSDLNSVATLVDTASPYKFVVAYRNNDSSYDGYTKIGTITSGNKISYGSAFQFESGRPSAIDIDRLLDDKFIIAYSDSDSSTYGYTKVGNVSSSNITYGSRYVFNEASTDSLSIAALDQYTVNIAYRDNGDSRNGNAITGYITSNVVSYGSEETFSAYTDNISNSYLPSTSLTFVLAYRDGGNSSYGTGLIGSEDNGGGPAVPEFPSWLIKFFIGSFGFVIVVFIGIYIKKKIIDQKNN